MGSAYSRENPRELADQCKDCATQLNVAHEHEPSQPLQDALKACERAAAGNNDKAHECLEAYTFWKEWTTRSGVPARGQ